MKKKTTSISTVGIENNKVATALVLLLLTGQGLSALAAAPSAVVPDPQKTSDCVLPSQPSPQEDVGMISKLLSAVQGKSAATNGSSGPIPFCASATLNLRKAEPGFKCKTSVGKIIERVKAEGDLLGETWRAEGSSLVWGDMLENRKSSDRAFVHADAVHACNLVGGRLPTADEFRAAKADQLQDAVPYMEEGAYWAADKVEPEYHYVFTFQETGTPYAIESVPLRVRCVMGPVQASPVTGTDMIALRELKKQWNPAVPQLVGVMKPLLLEARKPEEFLEILDPGPELKNPTYSGLHEEIDRFWETHARAFMESSPSQDQVAKALSLSTGPRGPTALGKAWVEQFEGNPAAWVSAMDLVNRSIPVALQSAVIPKILEQSYQGFLRSHPSPAQIQRVIDVSSTLSAQVLHALSTVAIGSAKTADDFTAMLLQIEKNEAKVVPAAVRGKDPLDAVIRENYTKFLAMNPTREQVLRFNELRPETRITDKLLFERLAKAKTAADFVAAFEIAPKSTRQYVWEKVAPDFNKLKPTAAQLARARELGASEKLDQSIRAENLKSAKDAEQVLAVLDQGYSFDDVSGYFDKNSREFVASLPKGRSAQVFKSAMDHLLTESASLALRAARAESAATQEEFLQAFESGKAVGSYSSRNQTEWDELFRLHLERLSNSKFEAAHIDRLRKLASTQEARWLVRRIELQQAKSVEEYINQISSEQDPKTRGRLIKATAGAFLDKRPASEQYQHVLTLNENPQADLELRRLSLQRAKSADEMVSSLSVATTRYTDSEMKPLNTLVDQSVPRFLKLKPSLRQIAWLRKNYKLNPSSLDLIAAAVEERAKTLAEKQLFPDVFPNERRSEAQVDTALAAPAKPVPRLQFPLP